jgi:eukaryotic-like serine/threonine-protein kinase
MTTSPDRWATVERLFHAALARPSDTRAAFLAEACAGDEELQREVQSLLAQEMSRAGVLTGGGIAAAAGVVSDIGRSTLAGCRIGAYQVLAPIGAGGMGEVYRARDTRLGREVAIKILPRAFTADPDRLARFEREARVLASLNHPHIAAIYGLEEAPVDAGPHTPPGSPVRALVLELVDGETLAERIARAGSRGLPINDALDIARQVAEALDAAHEKGIVHRDLKPANIKVTPQGAVKVLDFGLAKLEASEGADGAAEAPTITVNDTREGLIVGTAAYMSPEQARGQAVDKRTDIWSFGCVVYEMLTGRAAFGRATLTDTLAAVINSEPDWTCLPAEIPSYMSRLVRRCLAKEPRQRFRDIGDARFELQEAPPEPVASDKAPAAAKRRLRPAAVVALSLAVGAAVAGLVAWGLAAGTRPAPPAAVAEAVRVSRLTDSKGLEEFPAVSPDGKSVAFVADTAGNRQIFVRLIAGGGTLQLTQEGADHIYPRWAPDSASILYYSPAPDGNMPGAIWEIPALGGSTRRIASSLGAVDVSHDGSRIVFPHLANGRMELAVSARDGSNLKAIAPLEPGYYYLTPRWSPDDRTIAYQRGFANAHEIFVVPADGGEPRQITHHGALIEGLTWTTTSASILFSSSQGTTMWYLPPTNLWSIDADGRNLRQLTFGEGSYAYPDVTRGGVVVASRVRREFDIWRYPVDGSPVDNARRGVRITNQTSNVHTPSVAPDNSNVVYVSDSGSHANLWVTNLMTGASRQLTFERDPERRIGLPLWSPDRGLIAYFMAHGSSYEYFLVDADGSNSRLLMRDAGFATWSPDGKWLYYYDYPAGKYLRKVSVDGGPPMIVRADNASRPAIAPDGTTLYYVVELPVVTGGSDLEFRVAKPEDGPSRLLTRIPVRRTTSWQVFQPIISPDGKSLAFVLQDGTASNLWTISTSTGALRQLTDFGAEPTFIARRASWSTDGRFVFAAVGRGDSDVVLLEGLKW